MFKNILGLFSINFFALCIMCVSINSYAFNNESGNFAPAQEQNMLNNELQQQNLQYNVPQQQQQQQPGQYNSNGNNQEPTLYDNDYYVGPYNNNGPWGPKTEFDRGNPNSELYMP